MMSYFVFAILIVVLVIAKHTTLKDAWQSIKEWFTGDDFDK